MIKKAKTFVQSAFPSGVSAYARTKERVLSSYRGEEYVKDVFSYIYDQNDWQNPESRSGRCATVEATERVRQQLPLLLQKFGVRSMLDAPCGDFNWMQHTELDLDNYIGADIVPDMIKRNQKLYARPVREFRRLDITKDKIPTVDLIFSRDCLIHLSLHYMAKAIANFKKSGSRYLLTTTYTSHSKNTDIRTGDCRFINLQIAPFNLPDPIELIVEEPETGKSMALWSLDKL
jgi:SAM-dependent methyltransferase